MIKVNMKVKKKHMKMKVLLLQQTDHVYRYLLIGPTRVGLL